MMKNLLAHQTMQVAGGNVPEEHKISLECAVTINVILLQLSNHLVSRDQGAKLLMLGCDINEIRYLDDQINKLEK